jgi:NADH dehydrogenase FAD-containing subunit
MSKHLVFVGGGHAHLSALVSLGDYMKGGDLVTLISPSGCHYYSGMGPGLLSGIYKPWQTRFNVRKMVENRGGGFIEGSVKKIDPRNRMLFLEDGSEVCYDIASFNTGSEVPLGGLGSRDEFVIPVKPVVNLYEARKSILSRNNGNPIRVIVVGGGPAGVEIAANVWRLLYDNGKPAQVTLVAGDRVLQGASAKTRHLAVSSLAKKGIRVFEGARVNSLENRCADITGIGAVPFDYAFIAVGIKPTGLFRDSGIPSGEDGGLLVNQYLQSTACPQLFGGGDCISLAGHNLGRVGVYAVRQAPILRHNLLAALEGGEMKRFIPQKSYMLILNMGDGSGILRRENLVWEGRFSFLLKNFIDKRFMKKFQVSGELSDHSKCR